MQNVHTKKIILIFGISLFIVGIFFLSSNYLSEKRDNAFQYMNSLLLEANETIELSEEVDIIEDSTSSLENNQTEVQVETKPKEEYVDPYLKYYIGSLEIPKINLNKGFTDINSKYNTVNKNLEVVETSTYPDVDKGNFIIAAHSGNSYLAYFRNLYKLDLGDRAYVNYNGKRYTYQIVNIYNQAKTGKIAIYRDSNKTCLTLVTCTKNSKTEQTIYILELINVENI